MDPEQEEQVNAFTEAGEPAGIVGRSRTTAPERSGLYALAGHVLLTRGGKLAVARRHARKRLWPGAYDFTASGMAAAGEAVRDAALREAHEELGVRLEPERLAVAASWLPRDGFFSVATVFTYPWDSDAVPFNPADIGGVEWLTPAELAAAAAGEAAMKPDLRRFVGSRLFEALVRAPAV